MYRLIEFLKLHRQRIVHIGIPLLCFLVGLALPSPFFHRVVKKMIESDVVIELTDTTNMQLADGSIYDGSIINGTTTRHGFGRLTTNDGSVFEGDWKKDRLPYGKRTTAFSIYNGKFDDDLSNNGFGIVMYTQKFIDGKRKQGLSDNEIVTMYVGNWAKNNKHGIGRSVNADGSMTFGRYVDGVYQKAEGANYRIGGSVYGIDLSHHQTDINWDELAVYCDKDGNVYHDKPTDKQYMQPVLFVYMKATEGATVQDDKFSVRMIEAERHGIVRGAYHFLRMGSNVEDQVKNFVETVTWSQGDLPPALDVEVDSEIEKYGATKLQDMVLAWLEKVEKAMHIRPIIYTRESIRNKYLNDSRFKKYDFWIARYSVDGPNNFDWHIWQRTEKGVVNGYSGNVDINLFKGDYAAFRKYLNSKND